MDDIENNLITLVNRIEKVQQEVIKATVASNGINELCDKTIKILDNLKSAILYDLGEE